MVDAIAHVTVGVADLHPVFDLWIDQLGLEIVERRAGPDPGLGQLWNIQAASIADQVLIRTPGADTGWLHFVQFSEPGAPVRSGAAPTDLCPKNIDVNCEDMPARYAELKAAGYEFRSAVSEYEVGGIYAREVQMPSHDDINVVLIEVLSGGFEMNFSPAGYAAMTSFVVVVPSTKTEAGFYAQLFGLDEIMHHRITGPGIEEVVGLPKESALDMRLMGREEKFFGRVELIDYQGLQGTDRFMLTKPPALGTLGCAFSVASLDRFLARAKEQGIQTVAHGRVETLFGAGPMCTLSSPAGLRIDVFERTAAMGAPDRTL
jgi:catechol 2,3-dioxygenase-like lactoylglutathione lyase family enzyme